MHAWNCDSCSSKHTTCSSSEMPDEVCSGNSEELVALAGFVKSVIDLCLLVTAPTSVTRACFASAGI